VQLADVTGSHFLDIGIEEFFALGAAHVPDPLRNPFVPDQAMAAHRNVVACTELQQPVRALESLWSRLRCDGSHLHRNVSRNDTRLRLIELAIGTVLVDDRTCSRAEHDSVARCDGAETLRRLRGECFLPVRRNTCTCDESERISPRPLLHS
jgi:hypothetical protein